MDERYIYALGDPRTGNIHWVGITLDPYQRRFVHHALKPSANLQYTWWTRDMYHAGVMPVMVILERITSDFAAIERDWIMRLLDEGHTLYNIRLRSE